MMINKAIAKITNEMMEKNDALARLIEEHLTEKCTSIAVAEKILDPNKQLAAIHRMIWDAARKRKEGNSAFIPDAEIYKMIDKYYGGAFYKEDFGQPAKVAAKINSYVESKTKNMIKDLLTPDFFSKDSAMVLLNTLYFEAKWRDPFPKDDTKDMQFHQFGGKDKDVRMMYQKSPRIAYFANHDDNVHAVILPYENPRFELVALMPMREGDDRGEAALKDITGKIGAKLDSWLEDRTFGETRLWLPKTDLTCKLNLGKTLQGLGMKTPFSDFADFSGIDTEEALKIENVVHKTALKMDEVSTKAAAATAIGMVRITSIGMPDPENIFRADRPFLVLIRDNETGLILFMGRINDPVAK